MKMKILLSLCMLTNCASHALNKVYAQKIYYPLLDQLPNNSPIRTKCLATRRAWFFKGKCQKSCEFLEYVLESIQDQGTPFTMVTKTSLDGALVPFALAFFLQENAAVQTAIATLVQPVYVPAEVRNFVAYALFLQEEYERKKSARSTPQI